MNSLVIVLFLSGMVAMIMLRTLHKDIARYNQMDSTVSETFELFFSLPSIVLTFSSEDFFFNFSITVYIQCYFVLVLGIQQSG